MDVRKPLIEPPVVFFYRCEETKTQREDRSQTVTYDSGHSFFPLFYLLPSPLISRTSLLKTSGECADPTMLLLPRKACSDCLFMIFKCI